jgi:hypothetical protein
MARDSKEQTKVLSRRRALCSAASVCVAVGALLGASSETFGRTTHVFWVVEPKVRAAVRSTRFERRIQWP